MQQGKLGINQSHQSLSGKENSSVEVHDVPAKVGANTFHSCSPSPHCIWSLPPTSQVCAPSHAPHRGGSPSQKPCICNFIRGSHQFFLSSAR